MQSTRRYLRTTIGILLSVSMAVPALGQSRPRATATKIPDGTYDCRTWSGSSYIGLGKIRSVNNSLDTKILAKVGATFTGVTPTKGGITVNYTSARGYRESMDCTRV